jgi:hypothetical protein
MERQEARLTMKLLLAFIVAGFLPVAGESQNNAAGFCSSRTTEAYHSPKCNWWEVHDPGRVDDVKLPHHPRYHTYSRWMLGDRTYVFAYRDIDQQPSDMAVDIYAVEGSKYRLVLTIQHLGEIITGVITAKMTGARVPDIVFKEECGELHCIVVVRFAAGKPKQVFSYAASSIDLRDAPKPLIVAESKIANTVEQFAWDARSEQFRKIR